MPEYEPSGGSGTAPVSAGRDPVPPTATPDGAAARTAPAEVDP